MRRPCNARWKLRRRLVRSLAVCSPDELTQALFDAERGIDPRRKPKLSGRRPQPPFPRNRVGANISVQWRFGTLPVIPAKFPSFPRNFRHSRESGKSMLPHAGSAKSTTRHRIPAFAGMTVSSRCGRLLVKLAPMRACGKSTPPATLKHPVRPSPCPLLQAGKRGDSVRPTCGTLRDCTPSSSSPVDRHPSLRLTPCLRSGRGHREATCCSPATVFRDCHAEANGAVAALSASVHYAWEVWLPTAGRGLLCPPGRAGATRRIECVSS